MECAYCKAPAQGNYSIHRDGFCIGPEVPLCDDCGAHAEPTCEEIWEKISMAPRAPGIAVPKRRHPRIVTSPLESPSDCKRPGCRSQATELCSVEMGTANTETLPLCERCIEGLRRLFAEKSGADLH